MHVNVFRLIVLLYVLVGGSNASLASTSSGTSLGVSSEFNIGYFLLKKKAVRFHLM